MLHPNALPPAIFLMGPTASGKTGVAVELAQSLPVEIISVDSALVYRGMDIGTAKPDAQTLDLAPHHLIDIITPLEAYSAAQFRSDALALMANICARGRIPLLVGGTMLYFNALQQGLSPLPQADAGIRARLDAEAAALGWPELHRRLQGLDPDAADRIRPNDSQRIQRALEVIEVAGEPMSAICRKSGRIDLPYRLLKLALVPSDRAVLHRRIAQRFDLMLAQGLREELIALRSRHPGLSLELPAMRCVGYRQMWLHLEGELDFSAMREQGIAATRQLAKRQLTWLRGMRDTDHIDCLIDNLPSIVRHAIGGFL